MVSECYLCKGIHNKGLMAIHQEDHSYYYYFSFTCTHPRTHARTHARTYARTHARTHTHTHTRTHTYRHTHARTHARTHAHTHPAIIRNVSMLFLTVSVTYRRVRILTRIQSTVSAYRTRSSFELQCLIENV